MGVVTFGIPIDLANALVEAGGLTGAIETGTYLGSSASVLRDIVPQVWTVGLRDDIYRKAVERVGGRGGITLFLGHSPSVLADLVNKIEGPVLFWLDAHGGTFGGNDMPAGFKQCPVMDELRVISSYPYADESCILIDDARAFFGPMRQHNPDKWPTFLEIADFLRTGDDRYVTVLDDVIIAVPSALRSTVDGWWLQKLEERHGLEAMEARILSLPIHRHRKLSCDSRAACSLSQCAWNWPSASTREEFARRLVVSQ